jgi:hypothetical protein
MSRFLQGSADAGERCQDRRMQPVCLEPAEHGSLSRRLPPRAQERELATVAARAADASACRTCRGARAATAEGPRGRGRTTRARSSHARRRTVRTSVSFTGRSRSARRPAVGRIWGSGQEPLELGPGQPVCSAPRLRRPWSSTSRSGDPSRGWRRRSRSAGVASARQGGGVLRGFPLERACSRRTTGL